MRTVLTIIIAATAFALNAVTLPRHADRLRNPVIEQMPSDSLLAAAGRLYLAHDTDSCIRLLETLNMRGSRHNLTQTEADVLSRAINLLGGIYIYDCQNYEKGAALFYKAVDMAQRNDCPNALAASLNNLTSLRNDENRFLNRLDNSILSDYRRVYDLAMQCGNRRLALLAAVNLGTTACRMGRLPEAVDVLQRAAQIEGVAEYRRLQCRALLEWNLGNMDTTLQLLELSRLKAPAEDRLSVMDFIEIDNLRVRCLMQMHRNPEAAQLCRTMIDQWGGDDPTGMLFDTYSALIAIARSEGHHDQAKDWEVKMWKAMAQGTGTMARSIAAAKETHQIDRFRDELTLRDIMVDEYRLRVLIIAAWAVALACAMVVIWIKLHQIKKKNRLLVQKDMQLLETVPAPSPHHIPLTVDPDPEKDATESARVFAKVLEVFDNSDEIYTDGFSAVRLAELTGERQHVVSAAIKQTTGAGFGALLAERRIREASRRIIDRQNYGHLTIEAIGQGVGYKSRSHFCTTFKKITGVSPGEYVKYSAQPSPTPAADVL